MESHMKNINLYFNKLLQAGTIRDVSFLCLIVIFVFNSLPVSIMGNESIVHYFFAEKSTKIIHSVKHCLNPYQPCEVELNSNSRLSVTMPALVSIADTFDVSAKITGLDVEQVTVTFMGIDHSHGLLPQTMEEIQPQSFHVKGKLSYCGYRNMDWIAMVTVYTEQTTYKASFSFKSIDTRVDEVQIDQKTRTYPYSENIVTKHHMQDMQ